MLQKLVGNIPTQEKRSPIYIEFHRYLMVTHLLIMKSECVFHGLENAKLKANASILRYCKDIILAQSERGMMLDWVLKLHNELQSGISFPTAGLGKMIPYTLESLPTRACEFCKFDGLYEASLYCLKCKAEWEPCMITGYPLVSNSTVKCKTCHKGALKEAMVDYFNVTKRCPWCTSKQVINVELGKGSDFDSSNSPWEQHLEEVLGQNQSVLNRFLL